MEISSSSNTFTALTPRMPVTLPPILTRSSRLPCTFPGTHRRESEKPPEILLASLTPRSATQCDDKFEYCAILSHWRLTNSINQLTSQAQIPHELTMTNTPRKRRNHALKSEHHSRLYEFISAPSNSITQLPSQSNPS